MRIAFDLDETLVPLAGGLEYPPLYLRPLFPERLRAGTVELLRRLGDQGHDIWVYTTSLRSPLYIRWWFRALRIRLGGVVNQTIHDKRLLGYPQAVRTLSKYPPAFGIDLLVDDLPGLALEGRRHGFDVLVLDPEDPTWVQKVDEKVVEIQSSMVGGTIDSLRDDVSADEHSRSPEVSERKLRGLLVNIVSDGFNRSLGALERAGAVDTTELRRAYHGVGTHYYDMVTEQIELTARYGARGLYDLFMSERAAGSVGDLDDESQPASSD